MAIDIASRLASIGKLPTPGRPAAVARTAVAPADWAAVQESRPEENRLPGGAAFAREATSKQVAQAYQTQASAVRGGFSLNESRGETRESRSTTSKRDAQSSESRELAQGLSAYAASERVISGSYSSRSYAGTRLDVML